MIEHPSGSALRDLLANVESAVNGETRSTAGTPSRPAVTDADIAQLLLARLPEEDCLALRQSGAARSQALSAARANEIDRGLDAMRHAEAAVDRRALTRAGRLVAHTLNEAAAAYVDYRAGRYAEAWRRTEDALASTNALQDECAFPHMTQRRVHLVTNLVHMEARRGNAEAAIALAWPLLGYIEGDTSAFPLPALRGGPPSEEIDDASRRAMADSLTSEMALALGADRARAEELLRAGRVHAASPALRPRCSTLERAHEWIRLQCAIVDGDVAAFLAGAALFLGAAHGRGRSLWRAVLADVLRCCESLGKEAEPTRRLCAAVAAQGVR